MNIPVKRIIVEVLIGCLIIILYCPNNIYYPIKNVYESVYPHENIIFSSYDGKQLSGWYVPPKDGYPTILFSHGNGGNISYFFDMLIPAAEKGYGVFIYDYRGYGNSKGFPSENGLYNDARGAVNFLNKTKNTPDSNIILWGLSIGGGVTSKIANENNFKAVILQSTFTNIKDMGIVTVQRVTGLQWSKYFVKLVPFFQNFDNNSRINKITEPLLIIHSREDNMIPFSMAVKNHERNTSSKLVLVSEDGHNDYEHSLPEILKFIDEIK